MEGLGSTGTFVHGAPELLVMPLTRQTDIKAFTIPWIALHAVARKKSAYTSSALTLVRMLR